MGAAVVVFAVGGKHWTSASYAVVMILVGLPLWWKTTAVHRVDLPHDDMLSLHSFLTRNLRISLGVNLKGFTGTSLPRDGDEGQSGTLHVHIILSLRLVPIRAPCTHMQYPHQLILVLIVCIVDTQT
jgi:hypothetical protein